MWRSDMRAQVAEVRDDRDAAEASVAAATRPGPSVAHGASLPQRGPRCVASPQRGPRCIPPWRRWTWWRRGSPWRGASSGGCAARRAATPATLSRVDRGTFVFVMSTRSAGSCASTSWTAWRKAASRCGAAARRGGAGLCAGFRRPPRAHAGTAAPFAAEFRSPGGGCRAHQPKGPFRAPDVNNSISFVFSATARHPAYRKP